MAKSRASILLRLLLAILLVAGAAAWLGRDLPRWAVERLLAGAAGARVELGELALVRPRRLVLRRLRVVEIAALPIVAALTIDELRITASSAPEMLAGRFERVEVDGLAARLVPAAFELSDEPLPVAIGELEIAAARISVATAQRETGLVVAGILRRIGGATAGKLSFNSPRLDLAPLLALFLPHGPPPIAGGLRELGGALEIGGGGTAVGLKARAAGAVVDTGDLRLELPDLRLEASIAGERRELAGSSPAVQARWGDPRAGRRDVDLGAGRIAAVLAPSVEGPGALHFELVPELAVFDRARIAGDWHPGERRVLSLAATVDRLRLDALPADPALAGEADLAFTGDGDRLGYRLTVRPTRLAAADRSLDLEIPGTTLTVTGETAWANFDELAGKSAADLPPAFAGPFAAILEIPAAAGHWGEFAVPAAALPLAASFTGELDGGGPDRRPAFRGNAGLTLEAAGRLEADGELAFGGAGADADVSWHWRRARLEELRPLIGQLGLTGDRFDGLALAGGLEADGRLRGPLAGPAIEATVTLRDLAAARGEVWQVTGAAARGDLAVDPRGLRLRSFAAAGDLTLPARGPIPLTLEAQGRGDLDLAAGTLAEATLESPGLGRLRLSGDWLRPPGLELAGRGRIVAEEIELGAWQRALGLDAAGGPDLALSGRIEADLEAELPAGAGGWRLAGPVCVRDGGFTSPDGARVMEGLAATAEVRLDGVPGSPVAGRARGRAGGFLLLWDAFFGDFSQVAADLDLTATVDGGAAADGLDGGEPSLGLRADFELPRGPRLAVILERPGGGEPTYRLRLDDEDLAATHERYLRQVLSQLLGDADLGGAVSARLRGGRAADGTWTVGGDLRLSDLTWTGPGGEVAVAGLDLILPLDLRLADRERPAAAEAPPPPRRHSRLRFDRLAFRDLELPPTDSGLWVEGDSLGIDEPIELVILGGAVTLERLTLRRLLAPGRYLETGLRLSALQLAEISRALELFPLEGTLEGSFPRVRLSGNALRVEGGGEIALFGGTVQVSDISGDEIFTRFPKLTLSAQLREIDLGRLTRRIDFGEMTGILEGSIAGCELFRGIPVRCRAHFETVRREGVPRTVDVKAINNLTILSTGANVGFLDRGIRRFFKRYTYDRLAFDVVLDRDVLLLHGLERHGDKELFLRGRLPFPIDVVNAQPGRTVSFQTMLRRLKSLEVGGATTSPPSDGD